MGFQIKKTKIKDLVHIIPAVYDDERGYFTESYNQQALENLGFKIAFVQDNESKSQRGVLRGLHFQTQFTQGKLVRCILGQVLDVAVDLRKKSTTYLQWDSVVLDSKKKNMFYVPEGFAHGFLVLSQEAVFSYKCTNYYMPEFDAGIRWDDSTIGIDWQLEKYGIKAPILSEKDKNLTYLNEIIISF